MDLMATQDGHQVHLIGPTSVTTWARAQVVTEVGPIRWT